MAKTKRGVIIYKSYSFVDKDPVIDMVRTAVEDSSLTYRDIKDKGGPSPTCLSRWFDGNTRRPQFCTIMSAYRAVGGDVILKSPSGMELKLPGKPVKPKAKKNKSVQTEGNLMYLR